MVNKKIWGDIGSYSGHAARGHVVVSENNRSYCAENAALNRASTGRTSPRRFQLDSRIVFNRNDHITRADEVCENIFTFRDHWEMEKTRVSVQFEDAVDWYFNPEGDPEWTFALSRHSFLPTLAKAYALTGDKKYGLHYERLLSDWIDKVPLNEAAEKLTWRPISVGLRCENWLRSLELIKPAVSGALVDKLEQSLRVHADFLVKSHGDFQRLSNWGVLQDRGLFLAGVYFEDKTYTGLSLKRLNDNLRLQVLPDGIHWEQSPHYHAEVLQCLLTVAQAARRFNIALPEGFAQNVHRMAKALALWIKPNGRLPCQSDSDHVDARDVLVQSAVLFNDASLKSYADGEVFDENIWNMGAEAVEAYKAMPMPPKETASAAFPYSGNYILRDAGHYLHMHCGCLGSGHGHADLLHIDLFAHGEDVLIDSGRYSYVDGPVRRALKSPAAHNTVTVDGADFTVYKNSWDYTQIAYPVKGEYRFEKDCGLISGGHLGYLDRGVFVFRKVVQAASGLYVIFDALYAEGKHRYTQYFHFNNEGEVLLQGNRVLYNGKRVHAALEVLTPGAELALNNAPLSRTYNELEEGKCARVGCERAGFAGLVTVISTGDFGAASLVPVSLTRTGEVLPEAKAQAVSIGGYTVICLHGEVISEVGLIEANGRKGYGKVMVFPPEIAVSTENNRRIKFETPGFCGVSNADERIVFRNSVDAEGVCLAW